MNEFIKQRLIETTAGGNEEEIMVYCCECGEELPESEANKQSGYCAECLKIYE